ncbi:hypothetical protein ACJQWK_03631 [Exserohilum turcicum]
MARHVDGMCLGKNNSIWACLAVTFDFDSSSSFFSLITWSTAAHGYHQKGPGWIMHGVLEFDGHGRICSVVFLCAVLGDTPQRCSLCRNKKVAMARKFWSPRQQDRLWSLFVSSSK